MRIFQYYRQDRASACNTDTCWKTEIALAAVTRKEAITQIQKVLKVYANRIHTI